MAVTYTHAFSKAKGCHGLSIFLLVFRELICSDPRQWHVVGRTGLVRRCQLAVGEDVMVPEMAVV